MEVTSKPTVEIEIAGAIVAIPSATIAELWLAKLRAPAAPRSPDELRIGDVVDGATFMGIVRGESGARDLQLFDLGEAPERMNFEAAKKWAAEKGGSLPTRREQSIMFGNRAEGQYKQEWYWSSEQYAGAADCAWIQGFGDGSQTSGHKGTGFRARAVRRQVIQ